MTAAEEPPVDRERREAGIARFWDARAARYDGHYDTAGPDGYSLQARLALTLRLIGEGPGAVLDVGMGAGRLCDSLARRGWTVSGVDVSEEMVALAQERLPEARERLVRAPAEQLPFSSASFDAVAATGSLEYSDLPRALAEVSRVLRPGGLSALSYPNPSAFYALWKTRAWYPGIAVVKRLLGLPRVVVPKGGPSLSPARFRAALDAAGLRAESVQYTGYLLLPAPLDGVFPGATARLGRKLEGSGPLLGRLLATQVLYAGRKPMTGSAAAADEVEERADG